MVALQKIHVCYLNVKTKCAFPNDKLIFDCDHRQQNFRLVVLVNKFCVLCMLIVSLNNETNRKCINVSDDMSVSDMLVKYLDDITKTDTFSTENCAGNVIGSSSRNSVHFVVDFLY